MNTIFTILPILILSLGLVAENVAAANLQSLLQVFAMSEQDAQAGVFTAVTDTSYAVPNAKALRAMPTDERIAAIEVAGTCIKEFLASDEFRKRYNQFRLEQKPVEPEAPKTSGQMQDEQRRALQQSIAEMESSKKQLPEEQRAVLDEVITGLKQQLTALDSPENQVFTPDLDKQLSTSHEMQMAEYRKKIAEWESHYPENNPVPLIRKWLATFLEESADIDFEAQTVDAGKGIIKFVDQEYERKNKRWKLYFRSGRETVAAARKFAQNWLAELQ